MFVGGSGFVVNDFGFERVRHTNKARAGHVFYGHAGVAIGDVCLGHLLCQQAVAPL